MVCRWPRGLWAMACRSQRPYSSCGSSSRLNMCPPHRLRPPCATVSLILPLARALGSRQVRRQCLHPLCVHAAACCCACLSNSCRHKAVVVAARGYQCVVVWSKFCLCVAFSVTGSWRTKGKVCKFALLLSACQHWLSYCMYTKDMHGRIT